MYYNEKGSPGGLHGCDCIWLLDLQLSIQLVPISNKVCEGDLHPPFGKVDLEQTYVNQVLPVDDGRSVIFSG